MKTSLHFVLFVILISIIAYLILIKMWYGTIMFTDYSKFYIYCPLRHSFEDYSIFSKREFCSKHIDCGTRLVQIKKYHRYWVSPGFKYFTFAKVTGLTPDFFYRSKFQIYRFPIPLHTQSRQTFWTRELLPCNENVG